MTDKPHPNLTLRQCFERFYDQSELRPMTIASMRHSISAFERLTDNPPIGEITDETMAQYRQAAIDHPYSAETIKSHWTHFRSILRRMAPKFTGNPRGLGVIETVPWMKPVKQVHKRPRFVTQDELEAFYIACGRAQYPKSGMNAPNFWRTLICLAYTTGLRKSDLWALTWEQLDFQEMTLDFTSRKTGKADVWPLHPVAADHLMRLRHPKRLVIGTSYHNHSSTFYKIFRELREEAGVDKFGLHDLRRTGASQLERVAPGLGAEFMQHVGKGITELRYLNRFDQLRDALEQLPLPTCFRHGPKITGRLVDKRQQAKAKKPPRPEIDAPPGPDSRDWKFRAGQYWCRGCWYPMPSTAKLGMLKQLVESDGPVSWRDLCRHLKGSPKPDCDGLMEQRTPVCTRVHVCISQVRKRLREDLCLPDGWDAVPCTQRGGTGGSWTIWLPEKASKVNDDNAA